MAHLESLRELLINQYMLHEVQHHFFATTRRRASTAVAPLAHTLVDIYKCLHQGEFGVEHLVGDRVGFRERLGHDLLGHLPAAQEPLLECVATDGGILRVNLRPYRASFGDKTDRARDLLTDACLASANINKGRPDSFLSKLFGFRELNRTGQLAIGGITYMFPSDMVDHFLMELRALVRRTGEIPVFGHSPLYRKMNDPSYRVVDLEVIGQSPLAFLLERRKS